ncbi:MAG: polymer-forming cytoskeletal protein [Gammaproteobacteria bacterium]
MSLFDKRNEDALAGSIAPDSESPQATEPVSEPAAMIGKTIRIKGNITGAENLTIDGHVEGSVDVADNDLTIGASGRVHADVGGSVIRIDGEVHGDIAGLQKVTITKTGKVEGNIISPEVTLEAGAKFKGSIDMDSPTDHVTSSARVAQGPKSVPRESPAAPEGEATV